MPPKGRGGRGQSESIDYVVSLRRKGFDDELIRQQLKADNFGKGRISQLMVALANRESRGHQEELPLLDVNSKIWKRGTFDPERERIGGTSSGSKQAETHKSAV